MALKDYEVEILKNVEKHGWHATTVLTPTEITLILPIQQDLQNPLTSLNLLFSV